MPRLRAVKTKEEAAAVPSGEPVQVVFPSEDESGTERVTETKPEKVVAPVPREEPEPQPDISALQKQLEAAQKAEKIAQEALRTEQQRTVEAVRQQETLRTESNKHQENALQAQYDAIVNAMEASRVETESAQRDIENASANADYKTQAEAFSRLARAQANIAKLEDGKYAIEARREAEKNTPKEEPKAQTDPFEAAIAAIPESGKVWLRAHPEYMTNQRQNAKIQSLHWDIIDEGHRPFSEGYLESMEIHLGLKEKPKAAATEEPEEDEPKPRKSVVTQAPPTREVPSPSTGKTSSTKVTLTPEEREVARSSGIDELEYARQKIKLQDLKQNGHYQER